MISDSVHNFTLHISNNYPSACWPCIIWIIWPAKRCNSEFFIATLHSYWLQLRGNMLEASKCFSSGRFHHSFVSIGYPNSIFLLGTRIPWQQSVFLSNQSHLPGRRRRSNIGRFSRTIRWNQGQTLRIPPVSEPRHRPISQECTTDPCHFGRIGG